MKARGGKLGVRLSSLLLTLILMGMLTLSFSLVAATSMSANTNMSSPNARHSISVSTDPPSMEWNVTYGGTGGDSISSLVQTHDGGYALAGSTNSYGAGGNDAWLVKTDADGNGLWNQTYGWTLGDGAVSLIQADDDGYALAGVTIVDPHHSQNVLFVKTDKDGKMQWNKTYLTEDSNSVAYSLIQTRDGGYALCGYTTQFGGSRFLLIKTDMHGNTQWVESYGGTEPANAQAMIQTDDGGYALAGFAGPFFGPYDCFLVKTDADGKMLWNRTYGGTGTDQSWSLVQTDDGGYALLCTTYSFGAGNSDLWLIKTDADGEIQWNVTYGGTGNDNGRRGLVQTHDGGYALAGITNSSGAGGFDAWLVKTDADGNALWNQTYGGTGDDQAEGLIQTDDGGYALAGYMNSDGWLVKVAAESNVFHDVDVVDFRTSKTGCVPVPCVGQDFKTNLTVVVKNQGSYSEISNVTVYVDAIVIGTLEDVNLSSGDSVVINFAWNTSGFAMGSHTLNAFVWPISGENDTSDNIRYQ